MPTLSSSPKTPPPEVVLDSASSTWNRSSFDGNGFGSIIRKLPEIVRIVELFYREKYSDSSTAIDQSSCVIVFIFFLRSIHKERSVCPRYFIINLEKSKVVSRSVSIVLARIRNVLDVWINARM